MPQVNIGLGQATRLAQMSYQNRLEFIAEGLPVVRESARSFLAASKSLAGHARESEVLRTFAKEEAAKALILIDILRCPRSVVASRVGAMARWFYNHLARLIYADACTWKPMHVSQLQEYVNSERRMHVVEGDFGEYIFPNWRMFERESRLYADIASQDADTAFWSIPNRPTVDLLARVDPPACMVVEALAAVGALSAEGAQIVAEVWSRKNFCDTQTFDDSRRLTQEMLEQLIERKLVLDHASDDHVRSMYNLWQFPMYNIEFRAIEVSMAELKAEQDALCSW